MEETFLIGVITGHVPVIHAFLSAPGDVDGRDWSGHDNLFESAFLGLPALLEFGAEPDSRGLDPGIDASDTGAAVRAKDMDGRDKPGHDDKVSLLFVSEH